MLDRIDIRVGTIIKVDDIAGSDKLVALRVTFGDHERTIVAGMKRERENPRAIEGRQALFVVNLAPRKLCGVLSEGMLFDIGYQDGIRPALAVPEFAVPDGARAGTNLRDGGRSPKRPLTNARGCQNANCSPKRNVRPSFRVFVICPKFGDDSSTPGSTNCGVLKKLIDSARNVSRISDRTAQTRESDAFTL